MRHGGCNRRLQKTDNGQLDEICIQNFSRKISREENTLAVTGVYGEIILKWILKKWYMKISTTELI
jgi:hypothetical protein